jgi:LysM repeat protein
MENDSISSSSSESKLPLILGIAGFALGAAALVLGYKAKGEAASATAAAAGAAQQVAAIEEAVKSKATKVELDALGAAVQAADDRAKQNVELTQKAISELQAAATKKASAPAGEKGGKTAAAAGPGEYSVVAGDNLGKIAKKVGITLKALSDLNPGVDSNKLRIGQKLKTK